MSRHERFRLVLDTLATIGILAAAAVIVWGRVDRSGVAPTQANAAPRNAIESVQFEMSAGGAVEGSKDAKIALVEFADFQCPYCGKFVADTYPSVKRDFIDKGMVRYIFRNYPLETIHQFALKASEAAECAGQQGKYWPMHGKLFANQRNLQDESLVANATALGLDANRFRKCLGGEVLSRIKDDETEAKRLGVQATPTFFVGHVEPNGKLRLTTKISGALPYETFKTALKKAM